MELLIWIVGGAALLFSISALVVAIRGHRQDR